jgi:hypothetical protein
MSSKEEAIVIDDLESEASAVPPLPSMPVKAEAPEEKKAVKRKPIARFRGETYKIMDRKTCSDSLSSRAAMNKAAIVHARQKRARFEALRDEAQENAASSARQADFCWEQVDAANKKLSDSQLLLKSDRHVREAIHAMLQISSSVTRHTAFMNMMESVTMLCGDDNLLLKEMAQQPFYIDVDIAPDSDEEE